MNKKTLEERMKEYEAVTNIKLQPRSCVAIRIDGHNFKQFTSGFKKPYDPLIIEAKRFTLEKLCKSTQNCIFGYEQSDEFLLLLNTYSYDTEPLMNNRLEKIVSLKAAEATAYFNESLYSNIEKLPKDKLFKAYFDCRAFCIPETDAANLIRWRVQDCKRNSVQMVARSHYSHKQVSNKNLDELKDMIAEDFEDWNNLSEELKFGCYSIRKLINEKKHWHTMPMIDCSNADFYNKFTDIIKIGYTE